MLPRGWGLAVRGAKRRLRWQAPGCSQSPCRRPRCANPLPAAPQPWPQPWQPAARCRSAPPACSRTCGHAAPLSMGPAQARATLRPEPMPGEWLQGDAPCPLAGEAGGGGAQAVQGGGPWGVQGHRGVAVTGLGVRVDLRRPAARQQPPRRPEAAQQHHDRLKLPHRPRLQRTVQQHCALQPEHSRLQLQSFSRRPARQDLVHRGRSSIPRAWATALENLSLTIQFTCSSGTEIS